MTWIMRAIKESVASFARRERRYRSLSGSVRSCRYPLLYNCDQWSSILSVALIFARICEAKPPAKARRAAIRVVRFPHRIEPEIASQRSASMGRRRTPLLRSRLLCSSGKQIAQWIEYESWVQCELNARRGCGVAWIGVARRTGDLFDGIHILEVQEEERLIRAEHLAQLLQHVQLQRGHVRLTPPLAPLLDVLLEFDPPAQHMQVL